MFTRNLIFGFVCFLLTACAQPTISPTQTLIAASATFTATTRSSATPSRTATSIPQPTATAWPTATRFVPPPTYTPAVPNVNKKYKLVEWDVKQANGVIQLLRGYPDTLSLLERGYHDYDYFRAYRYVAFAEGEALLRFVDNEHEERWLWDYAQDLAKSYEETKGQAYLLLISQALNERQISVDEIANWVKSHLGQGFQIETTELSSEAKEDSVFLLAVSDGYSGVFFWLRKVNEQYEVHYLSGEFNSVTGAGMSFKLEDVTDDGMKELLTFHSYQPGGPSAFYTELQVFDIVGLSPTYFEFVSPTDVSDRVFWCDSDTCLKILDHNQLQLIRSSNIFCPISQKRTYDFAGRFRFVLAETELVYLEGDRFDNCPFSVDSIVNEGSLGLLQAGLLDWPNEDSIIEYPADVRDGIKFGLALRFALSNQPAQAIKTFNELIASPTVITSTWVALAQKFLELYQTPADLYLACAAVPLCDTHAAIQQLTSQIEPAAYPLALERLQAFGVPVFESDYFDFEQDGQAEQWFTTRPNAQARIELWLLTRASGPIKAVFIGEIDSRQPQFALLPRGGFQIEGRNFSVERSSVTGEIFVNEVPKVLEQSINLAAQTIAQAQKDLFSGANPALITTILLKAQQSKDFDCKILDCAHFQYLLGLTYELAKDENRAVEAYLKLWQDYPENPYTIMARSKLETSP